MTGSSFIFRRAVHYVKRNGRYPLNCENREQNKPRLRML